MKKFNITQKVNAALKVLSQEFNLWLKRRQAFRADKESLAKGFSVSSRALQPVDKLNLTPWMANMVRKFDPNVDPDNISVSAPELKAEKFVEECTLKILERFVGEEADHYDRTKSIDDLDHYKVDCWRNLKRGKDLRHVTPEANQKLGRLFEPYKKQFSRSHYSSEMPEDLEFATSILLEHLPPVRASTDLITVSLPFQNKDANTGYPFFSNDRKKDPITGKTYGVLAMEMASRSANDYITTSFYPYVGFKRMMRGKARPIIGSSRVFNILSNRLVSPMVEAYKKSVLFRGYLDSKYLKESMVKLGDFVIKANKNKSPSDSDYILVENRDYSAYDTTITPDLRMLILAIDVIHNSQDSLTQDCLKYPIFSALNAHFIEGNSDSLQTLHGRILSGELRTNLDGSKINALMTFTILNHLNESNSRLIRKLLRDLKTGYFFMGDDNLTTYYNGGSQDFSDYAKKRFNTVIHPDKGEFGLFFLQRRVVKRTPSSKWIMVTPFTRIIRSLIYRENATGLGAAGWILMAWSLLYQLIEWPELMLEVAKMLMPYDKYRLGADLTLAQLMQLLKEEDSKASQQAKSSTVDKLNDGDPIKKGFYDQITQGSKDGYLSTIHRLIRTLK